MIRKTDLPKDFSNEKLEKAIENILTENSKENQDILTTQIIKTYLYTLMDINSEDKDKESREIKMLQKIENKETYLPVFTSEEEMQGVKEKCDFDEVLLDFDDISGIVLDTTTVFKGFIINPDSDNIIIEDELIKYIIYQNAPKDGKIKIKEGEELEVSPVEEENYPKEMIEALREHFKTQKNINKSYIIFLRRGGEESYLLITDFSGDKNDTFSKIAVIAKPYLKNMFLDQLEYDTQFGLEATKGLKPFYKKKIFGIV